MKRKSPIRHKVRSHEREGKPIREFERGSGQKSQRSVVVKQKEKKYPRDVSNDIQRAFWICKRAERPCADDYIDLSTTDMPLYDNMRDNPKYFEEKKGWKYEIKLIPTESYYWWAAMARKKLGASEARERAHVSDKRAQEYADMMKKGQKFPIPVIDLAYGTQEGRHRARALELLDVKQMPVMFVEEVD